MEILTLKILSLVAAGMQGWTMGMAMRRKKYFVVAGFLISLILTYKIFNELMQL